ncbi:MAG: hypothetical protein MAG458_00241 [Nitrosopumilus sp.]|nr:hypothetical protein [Nitrosopumilus sp.]
MPLSRSLSNHFTQNGLMINQDEIISKLLERKFRISHSYSTKNSYHAGIKKFVEFLRVQYNFDLKQLFHKILNTKEIDPLEVLDEFYTFLSNYKTRNSRGYGSEAINQYVRISKDLLNSQGCKIYSEDLKLKFRLPKKTQSYQKGLSREVINRVIRFANPKLATIILMACSSGMRIGEIIQLRHCDVEFGNPTIVKIRAETAKTRETRLTHISAEATNSLKDYLAKSEHPKQNDDYLFLLQHKDRIKNAQNRGDRRTQQLREQIVTLSEEERFAKSVTATKHNLEQQLGRCIKKIPELNSKNENGRNVIHFHAFRSWFKTQVTDAHQSDFAEALMGHKSLKLLYYRQNDDVRAKTYRDIEYSVTISDSTIMNKNYSEVQKDNSELRGMVEILSKQLRELERKIEIQI